MIAQTSKFPTIATIASMESTVVMAMAADSDMLEERMLVRWSLDKNKTTVRQALIIAYR